MYYINLLQDGANSGLNGYQHWTHEHKHIVNIHVHTHEQANTGILRIKHIMYRIQCNLDNQN